MFYLRLGDPDILASNDIFGSIVGGLEKLGSVIDVVTIGILPEWVGVQSDPVEFIDNGGVGAVSVGIPGVNVTNRAIGQSSTFDGVADFGYVRDESGWVLTDTTAVLDGGRSVSVEILATAGDTDAQVTEFAAVRLDGCLEGCDLVGESGS